MKLQVPDKVNPNSYVFKLGWTYPICFGDYYEFSQAKDILVPKFGLAATQWHFSRQGQGRTPVVKHNLGDLTRSPLDAKHFADSIKWYRSLPFLDDDYWIVFKEEKDRTLALMLLS